jgi:Cd2+/Zn2+-exporting ATPase
MYPSVSVASIPHTRPWASYLFNRRAAQALLVFLTLLCLVGSWTAEKKGVSWAVLPLNLLAYIFGGYFGIAAALAEARAGKLSVDFLMIVAAIGAALVDQWHEGATLLFLFSLSNVLQEFALERSRNAIHGLMRLRPDAALVVRNGREEKVPLEQIHPGDIVRVKPGDYIPVDGIVEGGRSDVDQASVTGESRPVQKTVGATVYAGTLNGSGSLDIRVTKEARETTLARVIQLVEQAQEQKARTQRFLDDVEQYYVYTVLIGVGLMLLVPWLFLGHDFAPTFYRAMVLLVVASPCALILSTPASVLSAIACGAFHGVLFKGGTHLESLAEVQTVAFDKTGTLTESKLRVTDVVVYPPYHEKMRSDELLAYAAALEAKSQHPIARAVIAAATERGLTVPEVEDFTSLPGRGLYGRINGYLVWIGGTQMFREHGEHIPSGLLERQRALEQEGKTVLVLHREMARDENGGRHEEEGGGWLGLIAVADTVRPDAAEAIRLLRRLGIKRVAMLTGDNAQVAEAIAHAVGVDEYHAELLPEQKVEVLHRLQKQYGMLMMVGDGVNDAPALSHAAVGVAMGGAGSDVALESADVVLMGDDLTKLAFAVHLSRRAVRILRYNVGFALAVIVILVSTVFLFGLPMPLGVVGHEGSTLLVVMNGLRLLGTRQPS